MKVISETRRVH